MIPLLLGIKAYFLVSWIFKESLGWYFMEMVCWVLYWNRGKYNISLPNVGVNKYGCNISISVHQALWLEDIHTGGGGGEWDPNARLKN